MKLTHAEVAYEHPAKGMSHCSECVHYRDGYPPGMYPHCVIVKDPIRPEDWCSKFKKA